MLNTLCAIAVFKKSEIALTHKQYFIFSCCTRNRYELSFDITQPIAQENSILYNISIYIDSSIQLNYLQLAIDLSVYSVFHQVISKLHNACLLYENWKKDNRPDYKPWLNPEQNPLPFLHEGDIMAMKHSATDPDLLGECDVTEDLCSDDSEQ